MGGDKTGEPIRETCHLQKTEIILSDLGKANRFVKTHSVVNYTHSKTDGEKEQINSDSS